MSKLEETLKTIYKTAMESNDDVLHDLNVCRMYLHNIKDEDKLLKEIKLNLHISHIPRVIFAHISQTFKSGLQVSFMVYDGLLKINVHNEHKALLNKYPMFKNDSSPEDIIKDGFDNKESLEKAKRGLDECIKFTEKLQKGLKDYKKEKLASSKIIDLQFIISAEKAVRRYRALKDIYKIAKYLR